MTPAEAFINATKARAKAYYYIFEEFASELGEKKAKEIFSRAIYKFGIEKSKNFSDNSKESPKKFSEAFVSNPISNEVFKQKSIEGDSNHAKVEMKNCPLVEMWKEMGLSKEKISTLCDIAYMVDFGKTESAGFNLKFQSRIADGDDCCLLEIKNK
jgi:hypothetical protein